MKTELPSESDAAGPMPAAADFILESAPLGLRAGIDQDHFNSLPDDLDVEEFFRSVDS